MLWVEEADGTVVGLIRTQTALDELMSRLNRNGTRERALLGALRKCHAQLIAGFTVTQALDIDPATIPRYSSDEAGNVS